jgi:SAM-dependent methyltransferase
VAGILNYFQNYHTHYHLLRQLIRPISALPRIRALEDLYQCYRPGPSHQNPTRALDLGCGTRPRNPFQASEWFGIDVRAIPEKNILAADLFREPIPFADHHFDYVSAFDFIEHVPRVIYAPTLQFPFVRLMGEIERVLKPDGVFFSHTPLYPFIPAISDPTHVNFVSPETFSHYFCGPDCLARMYGFNGEFRLLAQGRSDSHLISLLQKVSRHI